jgi:large subunit ribosomal protein L16
MLQPKRTKYRKQHRGRRKGISEDFLSFGDFGLASLEGSWITARQIEAARRVIVRYLRKGGNLWIRIFPDKPVTKKPAETRMGSGKGNVDHWVAPVKRGRLLFEIGGIERRMAEEAFRLASHKLPCATKFIYRDED